MEMLKKSIVLLVAFLLLLAGVRVTDAHAQTPDGFGKPAAVQAVADTPDYQTKAKAAVLMDAQTGRVLFAQNAGLRLPMASTTKIMTALLTLEQGGLDDYFQVDSDAIRVEGSSMGLQEGDSVSLRALAYGMLLASGNDGANAAAVRISGSIPAFVERMNARAAEIGIEDTRFATPSGLDDPGHYSTAYDMALLAREALQNPLFAEICAQSKAVVQYGNPPYNRWLTNHNRLLREYPGTIGVKTGFTKASGRCLVSCAERDGVRLIAVTLGCPDDWNEHRKLFDRYFGLLTPDDLSGYLPHTGLQLPVAGGTEPAVALRYTPPPAMALLEGDRVEVRAVAAPLVFAPVEQGDLLGHLTICCNGEPVAELPLTAAQPVEATTPSPRESLLEWLFT